MLIETMTPEQRARLDSLIAVPEGTRQSPLDRLRDGPYIQSGREISRALGRLERDVARFRGERDMASAQISRIQASISEANHKLEEVGLAFRNESG